MPGAAAEPQNGPCTEGVDDLMCDMEANKYGWVMNIRHDGFMGFSFPWDGLQQ